MTASDTNVCNLGIVAYINAYSKANTLEQLKTLIRSVSQKSQRGWIVIVISEADFLDYESRSEREWDRYLIIRHSVPRGMAQTWIIHRSMKRHLVEVCWQQRSSRADFSFQGDVPSIGVSVIATHFAHGNDWMPSHDTHAAIMASKPRSNGRYPLILWYRSTNFRLCWV